MLSKPQLNHNSTQPNVTLSWVRHEMTLHTPPQPPTEIQCLQYPLYDNFRPVSDVSFSVQVLASFGHAPISLFLLFVIFFDPSWT